MATRNRAILDLPMTAQAHDPTNLRTLDVSQYANHAYFGAGAAAPTKIAGQRGYSFSQPSTQYMYRNNPLTSANFTILVMLNLINSAANAGIVGTADVLGSPAFGLELNIWSSRIRAGGAMCGAWTQSNTPLGSNNWLTIGITKNGASGIFYFDGRQDGTFVAADPPARTYMFFGTGQSGTYLNGRKNNLILYPFPLTPIQVADWHQQAMASINMV